MLGRQEFQHYPLNNKELTSIMQEKQSLEKDIHETITEIRMLNSKMTKNENEMIYLKRLEDRERVLDNQKREMEEILRNHQYLQNQADSIMKSEHSFRATLGGEYRAAMEEKKNRQDEDRRRRIEEEQMLLHLNKRSMEISEEKKKKEMLETKRRFNQELIELEIQRQHEKDEKEREKEQFNKNLAIKYSQETQKDAAYKQYYNQFLINKSLPKNTYSDKATIETSPKEKPRSESTQKERLDLNKEEVRIYEDQSAKGYIGKDTLKSYLSQQINEKERKRQEEAENKRAFNQQYISSQQNSQKEYEQQARQKKRDQQRKYEEELTNQIRQKETIFRERESSPHRFYNNNVSPIDLKLKDAFGGNQYEEMKERNSGEREFKMRNLAMVGSNSIQ